MIYFLALIPATMLTIAGYFVIYLSWRAEGGLRAFGKYLGFWAFTLAALVMLAAIFAAARGPRGPGMMRGGMYGRPYGGPRFYGPPPMFGPPRGPAFGPPPGTPPQGTPPAGAPNPAAPGTGGATPRSQ